MIQKLFRKQKKCQEPEETFEELTGISEKMMFLKLDGWTFEGEKIRKRNGKLNYRIIAKPPKISFDLYSVDKEELNVAKTRTQLGTSLDYAGFFRACKEIKEGAEKWMKML